MTLYQLIADYRDYMNHFTRPEYPRYFDSYLEICRPVFAAVTDPQAAAAEFFAALQSDWTASRSRRKNKLLRQSDKLLLCCFLNPAACKLEEPARQVMEAFQLLWDKSYPDESYRIGTYDEIMKGFEPRILGFKIHQD